MCFRDLAKLNLLWWFNYKLEPIFDTAPAALKNEARVKSGQNWPKNNCLATYDLNPWNSLYKVKKYNNDFIEKSLLRMKIMKKRKMYFKLHDQKTLQLNRSKNCLSKSIFWNGVRHKKLFQYFDRTFVDACSAGDISSGLVTQILGLILKKTWIKKNSMEQEILSTAVKMQNKSFCPFVLVGYVFCHNYAPGAKSYKVLCVLGKQLCQACEIMLLNKRL